jgi:YidC/Oxa1 family membrane protein insertase
VENQRLLLYVALALVLYLIWLAWEQDYGPHQAPKAQVENQQQPSHRANRVGKIPAPASDVPDVPAVAPAARKPAARQAVHATSRIHVVTDVLNVEIDTRGGDIRRAALPTYPAQAETPNIPFVLLHDSPRLGVYIAQSGLIYDLATRHNVAALAPSHHAVYTAARRQYRLGKGQDELRVPLIWHSPTGVAVKKVFTFHRGKFLVDVTHTVINRGRRVWSGRQYRQLRHGPVARGKSSILSPMTFTGAAYYDGKYQKVPFEDMQTDPLSRVIKGGWAAMLQHYFVSAWVPNPNERNFFYTNVVHEVSSPQYIIGLRSMGLSVAPGETGVFHAELYIGPTLQERLGQIAKGLDLVVDYGIFTVLSKPLFWALSKIHGVVGNWGWAIVILTVLIKLAFYKLSETSYKSLAKMRAVQPRLMALKERYPDDKQKMNQALMELYKKEKINPLGGCLPILVQIPVFIALYWVLLESVELRQAPFILWINDLSNRDPYFVLPLLMGASMFIQQRLNPTPPDPIQAKVMMALPLVFTIFFAFFPAGLVLYWLVNNLLSIAQQWLITKRVESHPKPA